MSKIKFGWSEIDITPNKKVSLAGQFAERISEYVEKPITVTALAVSTDEDQMIMVSADIVSVAANLIDAIRDNLKDNNVGIDPMKVIVGAIHTHTGPVYGGKRRTMKGKGFSAKEMLKTMLPEGRKYVDSAQITNNPDIISVEETFKMLVERITKVILDAWSKRAEGSFSNAFARAAVGMCRRAVYNDGSAQMWGETNTAKFTEVEGGSDTGIELMYVFDGAKKLTGIIANLACPAQCVQHRLFVSPDFWGEVKVLIREYFGENIFLLAQCSAAGDQCPVDIVRWVEPESDVHDPNIERKFPRKIKADPSMFDIAGMKKAGKRIAHEIIETYKEGLDEAQCDVEFVHNVRIMNLPLRRVSYADVENAKREIKNYIDNTEGDVNYNDAAKLQIYMGILSREECQEYNNILETEVHIARLGTVAFATNPFELFLDYGNQIKARSYAEQTFLVQLANGAEGYLPTEKAEKGGHYSAFVSSGQVGHIGGDQLVRETLTEINKLFN